MHGCAGSRRRAGQANLRHIRGNPTPAKPAGAVRHRYRGHNRHGNSQRHNNPHGGSHRRNNRHDGRHRVDRGPRTGANHPAAPP